MNAPNISKSIVVRSEMLMIIDLYIYHFLAALFNFKLHIFLLRLFRAHVMSFLLAKGC